MNTVSRRCVGGLLAWAGTVGLGFFLLGEYHHRPGHSGAPTSAWPEGTPVAPDPARPTLVMFLHPRCPCSRASVAELAAILARRGDRVAATAVLFRPESSSRDWGRSAGLGPEVAATPGVRILDDPGGATARRFGVETSGHVLLYDLAGRLLYHRRHHPLARPPGRANPGLSAVLARLDGPAAAVAGRGPVFGCPTTGNAKPRGGDGGSPMIDVIIPEKSTGPTIARRADDLFGVAGPGRAARRRPAVRLLSWPCSGSRPSSSRWSSRRTPGRARSGASTSTSGPPSCSAARPSGCRSRWPSRSPAWRETRLAVAIGQMLMGGLLIHLSGGRIETHFHVFGSLAFLALYRDAGVLATATVVVVPRPLPARRLLAPVDLRGRRHQPVALDRARRLGPLRGRRPGLRLARLAPARPGRRAARGGARSRRATTSSGRWSAGRPSSRWPTAP